MDGAIRRSRSDSPPRRRSRCSGTAPGWRSCERSATPTARSSFSSLRERVGERDSGKFNYHLKKLTGRFVRRGDEGYELTLAGSQVVGALLAGTYTAEVSSEPIEVDHPCPECGGELIAEYAAERVANRSTTGRERFRPRDAAPSAPGSVPAENS